MWINYYLSNFTISSQLTRRVTSGGQPLDQQAATLIAVWLTLLLEHLLHPNRIEFLPLFPPYLSEAAAFCEPILFVEFDTTRILGRNVCQDICNTFFNRILFKRIEQHPPQAFSRVIWMYEIRYFSSM